MNISTESATPGFLVRAPSRRRLLRATVPLALMVASGRASAQDWPSRPIRWIVTYPPGGISDQVARLLAPRLSARLGQQLVVENRGGANGQIGIEALIGAPADGQTFAFAALSPLTVNPLVTRTPYAGPGNVAAVTSVMYSPVYLIATQRFKGQGFADVLSQAKAHPGELRVATSGIASVGHLMVESIKAKAGVDLTHVPYKGGAQVLTDAISGQFELFTANPTSAVNAQIAKGVLRVIAVTGPKRFASQPSVPTMAELGIPQANLTSMFGVFAPAGTADRIIQRMNQELAAALADPEVQRKLTDADNVPLAMPSAEFARVMREEFDHNAQLIKTRGIRLE